MSETNHSHHWTYALAFLFTLLFAGLPTLAQLRWPAITQESKPWTRWWWMGNAVNRKDLTTLMQQYRQAGLGGLEITPIYGVKGYEKQFIDFLSPRWMDMFTHTLKEGQRLGLGIDLANASGWPFGGPWVSDADACKYVAYHTYSVKGGESVKDTIGYRQQPLVRAVNHQVDIATLVEPINKNPDLQSLALDQVRFEKPLPLQVVMAYSDKGEARNLTDKVASNGQLSWVAPAGNWTVYAVFQGWHGKMVERAGPGGEGNVIDHFSGTATQHYLQQFDKAFAGQDLKNLRAFFNDSYEVDDAQGQADWTPALFDEFVKRRGYDLRNHLPALFGKDTEENNRRVRCDYRETISDLLLEKYSQVWHGWVKSKGKINRNQAHGSPANILDLYSVSDIPEIEGTDRLRIKFASSAAHVTGKKLTSSESATWDNEHFLSSLADVKKALDRFLLGGVNHVFYHGMNYSPPGETWPGWLFYAATHFEPSNPAFTDFAKLNQYVARCQSFLQTGKPSNDVLLYFPIYDRLSDPGKALLEHFDGLEKEFDGTTIKADAQAMLDRGYSFDFISDRQLANVQASNRLLQTGGVAYQTVVLPESRIIPLSTFEKLLELAQRGATIIIHKSMPVDVPGLGMLEERRSAFKKQLATLHFTQVENSSIGKATVGQGVFLLGDDLEQLLSYAGIRREPMIDQGLLSVRRSHEAGHYYFIANWSSKLVDGWVPLQTPAKSAALFNPMTEKMGLATMKSDKTGGSEVYLQLAPGETCVLETYREAVKGNPYAYFKMAGPSQPLTGSWTVKFLEGGPTLPAEVKTDTLGSWTDFGGEGMKQFSGTAQYVLSFSKPPAMGDAWLLDLGIVHESARVRLNGQDLGTLIGPTYQLTIPKALIKENNVLEVKVSNLMANRIADMDRKGENWKKFYNINVSARRKENLAENGVFTAAKWAPRASGLVGPVTLTPIKFE